MCVQSYRAISIVDPLPVPSDRSAHLALYIVHQQKYPRHHISHEWPSINFTEEHSSAFNGLLGSQSVSARDRHDFMHLTSHGNVDTVDVRGVSHKCCAGKMQRYTTAWLGTARLGTARLGTARHGTARLGTARHGLQLLKKAADEPPQEKLDGLIVRSRLKRFFMLELNRARDRKNEKASIHPLWEIQMSDGRRCENTRLQKPSFLREKWQEKKKNLTVHPERGREGRTKIQTENQKLSEKWRFWNIQPDFNNHLQVNQPSRCLKRGWKVKERVKVQDWIQTRLF